MTLIKGEKIPKNVEIDENCASPHHILHLILTSWCPNLVELSMVEKLTNIFIPEVFYDHMPLTEKNFPAFEENPAGFENNLNLESFTIKSNTKGSLFGHSIPIEYLRKIIKRSPKLKYLKLAALKGFRNDLADDLMPKDENSRFYNLQKLSVPMFFKGIEFAEQIIEENFPRYSV